MTTTKRRPAEASSVVLRNISWDFYQRFLEELTDQHICHTYDRGVLEIMSPLTMPHEHPKRLLAKLVDALVEELRIPVRSVGSLTLYNKLKLKGVEPDEGFYIANEALMRSKAEYDPETDPPPDLVIEVDHRSASVPRMPVYAALGVNEVWRYRREALQFYVLNESGKYFLVQDSAAFPGLRLDQFQTFVRKDPNIDETTWILDFRAWVRKTLVK